MLSFLAIAAQVALSSPASAQRVTILVPAQKPSQPSPVRLEAYIYRPATAGQHPVVVFNHGSSGGQPKLSIPAPRQAELFTRRGFIVVVPMRRGRGASEGTSLEGEDKNCDIRSWEPGLHAAFDDVTATIDYMRTVPDADTSRVLLVGASRGGFLSVAYAAEGPRKKQVAGVVNFVGGWVAQAEDNCPIDYNLVSFSRFAGRTRTPQLWFYGENDPFYARSSILAYAGAFQASGGRAQFRLVPREPGTGHWLLASPDKWTADLDEYLAARNLPQD